MGAKKKFRDQVYDHLLGGVITPGQARVMLGKEPLRAHGGQVRRTASRSARTQRPSSPQVRTR